ncbi:MAG: amidohydrolase family protein [Clostridiales Family XIII bacterium]|jgi:N-acyl-D-amino-acid deacylase|nr:amidohydrolase family protein [Clostridiales Family XIII bacterium]
MFDLVIKNGLVVDPSNRVHSALNIGVRAGKIAEATAASISGKEEIDAEGLTVTPGFVDMHMHEDDYDSEKDAFDITIADTMLKMGVTTAIGGNCGVGYANPAEYLDAVDRLGHPINLGLFAPQECVRKAAGLLDRYAAAGTADLGKMEEFLAEQLKSGCVGLSLGLEYIPGTEESEALTLMKRAAESGKPTAVHQRSDGNRAVAAVKEVIAYAKTVGCALQISHLSSMCSFGDMEEILSIIDDERMRGTDVGFDGYPYYAFCTHLGSAVFDDGFIDKYKGGEALYAKLRVASDDTPETPMTEERFLDLRARYPDALVVAHILDEREVDLCLSHPAGIVISDGLYGNGQGHPRGSGAFPKLIRACLDGKIHLTLDAAIEKITRLPALRLGLDRKGTLRAGADADIAIFDPARVKDEATYREPFKSPVGIEYVLIGGKVALKRGKIVNGNLGRSIRK